jgi:dihydrofolate synthase/folylpolyglutamate synthase
MTAPRSYEEAEARLLAYVNHEEKTHYRYDTTTHDLERYGAFLERIGSPHRRFPSLHVAGTNGKGSISTLLAAILREAGLRVGHYTSPHLVEIRERIALDGMPVSPERFTELSGKVLAEADPPAANPAAGPAGAARDAGGFRTTFELLTAMAFLCFAEEEVDCAVVEVGLGGRLDATNLLTPDLAVFGHIALDHQDILGDSLFGIAADKAAILKEGGTGVSGPQDEEPRAALEERAREVGAPLHFAADGSEWAIHEISARGQVFDIRAPWGTWEAIESPLPGRHQIENVRTVLRAVRALRDRGAALPDAAVRRALATTRVRGRIEVYPGLPAIVLDGAHNPDAAGALRETLDAILPGRPRLHLVGIAGNKDRAGFLRALLSDGDGVIATRYGSARSSEPADLAALAGGLGVWTREAPDLYHAAELALEVAPREAVITVTGSFYLVGEAYRILEARPDGSAAFRVGAAT